MSSQKSRASALCRICRLHNTGFTVCLYPVYFIHAYIYTCTDIYHSQSLFQSYIPVNSLCLGLSVWCLYNMFVMACYTCTFTYNNMCERHPRSSPIPSRHLHIAYMRTVYTFCKGYAFCSLTYAIPEAPSPQPVTVPWSDLLVTFLD